MTWLANIARHVMWCHLTRVETSVMMSALERGKQCLSGPCRRTHSTRGCSCWGSRAPRWGLAYVADDVIETHFEPHLTS